MVESGNHGGWDTEVHDGENKKTYGIHTTTSDIFFFTSTYPVNDIYISWIGYSLAGLYGPYLVSSSLSIKLGLIRFYLGYKGYNLFYTF